MDDSDGSELKSEWEWLDTEDDSSYSLSKEENWLEIQAAPGSVLWGINCNAPRLLQAISEGKEVEKMRLMKLFRGVLSIMVPLFFFTGCSSKGVITSPGTDTAVTKPVAKWLVIIESNCGDPAREDEFNEWYNNTHLPDILETPGVISATRYENIAPSDGQGKYLAAYEIEAEDLQAVMKAVGENMEKKKAAGRLSDLLQITSNQSFKQIFSLSR